MTTTPAGSNPHTVFEVIDRALTERHNYSFSKIFWHPRQLELALLGRDAEVSPVTAELVPTNECIYSCHDCTYGHVRSATDALRGKRKMSHDDMFRLIDRLVEARVAGIIATGGGEPFQHKHTLDGISHATAAGLDVGVYTMGALLNEDRIEQLMRARPTFVRVSLNAGRGTYNAFHDIDSAHFYDRVLKNIIGLAHAKRALGVPCMLELGILLNEINSEYLGELVDSFTQILESSPPGTIDAVFFRPAVNYRSPGEQVAARLMAAARATIESQLIPLLQAHSVTSFVRADYIDALQLVPPGPARCRGYGWAASIGYDGHLYAFSEWNMDPKWSYGSLLDHSLAELWEPSRRAPMLERIRRDGPPPVSKVFALDRLLDGLGGPYPPKVVEEIMAGVAARTAALSPPPRVNIL